MSKIRITKNCQDKETKQNFKAGQILDHKRGKEIISKGYAEAVVEEIEVKAEEVKPKRKRKAKAK